MTPSDRHVAVIACTTSIAFYLVCTGQAGSTELIACGGVAVIATVMAVISHQARSCDLSYRAPWLRIIARTLSALVRDTFNVGRVLLRAAIRGTGERAGVISLQPFDVGQDCASDAGRRAVVTLSLSLAPNGYVLRVLDRRNALAIHRLSPAAPDTDVERPG